MEEPKFKRVNIKVSDNVHKWFMNRSKATGASMSTLMFFALETYIQQQDVIPLLPGMLNALKEQNASGERKRTE